MADDKPLIETTLALLRKAWGQAVRGWLSPAKSESAATPDLLRAAGVDYVCDWVNEDMPFAMRTDPGVLHAMPHPIDMDDTTILVQNHHTEDDFRDQLCDQFDMLYRESATLGGRIMVISLHPWVIGQPYRIKALEDALAHIMRHRAPDIRFAHRAVRAGPANLSSHHEPVCPLRQRLAWRVRRCGAGAEAYREPLCGA